MLTKDNLAGVEVMILDEFLVCSNDLLHGVWVYMLRRQAFERDK